MGQNIEGLFVSSLPQDASNATKNYFDPPLDDMMSAHLRVVWALSEDDYHEAYLAHVNVIQNFIKVLLE